MEVTQAKPIIDFVNSKQLTLHIPVYQRNYEWKKENCDQLFEDIKNGIPDPENPGVAKKHYFGNIVYDDIGYDPFNGYHEYILIDGQQRITSIMLLLAAIRDEEKNPELKDSIDETYLKNSSAKEGSKIKLKQVEMDRDTYEKIINRDFDGINKSSSVYTNYERFRKLIRSAIKSGYTLKNILSGIGSLRVIAINLDSKTPGSESPQVIFESINATGKPLSQADLLRNYLLLEVGVEKQEEYYHQYWLTIEQNVGSNNISDFLNRYLVMRSLEKVADGTEYKTFKNDYPTFFIDAKEALSDLRKYSEYYQWIKKPETLINQPKTAALLNEAAKLRLVPATPTLMWLLDKVKTNEIEFTEFNNVLKIIMDWSFRARVVNNISTGEIGNILLTKILEILKTKPEDKTYSEHLYYELSNFRTHDIYPTDEEFKEAFVKYNFYKNYNQYVQEKLAEKYSNDKHLLLETVEHIMPQTLDSKKWPHVSQTEHAEWVNTIGNLVPMNQSDNSSNSNNSIEMKEENLDKSDWLITREYEKYKINGEWTIESIKNRAKDLSELAVKIWKAPLTREREIEVPIQGKVNENMVKIYNWISEFDLPNIIPAENQEKNNKYFHFRTQTMNEIMDTEDGYDIYYYEIVCGSDGDWNHVGLELCNYLQENITPSRRQVFSKIFEMNGKTEREGWKYYRAKRWDAESEEEIGEKEALLKILAEKIPEYEEELKRALKQAL